MFYWSCKPKDLSVGLQSFLMWTDALVTVGISEEGI